MPAKRPSQAPANRPTILICEDESLLLGTLVRDLTREGYSVLPAESGEAALEILGRRQVDLLITDLKLPGISGCVLLDQARVADPTLPAIVMSAYGKGSLGGCSPDCGGCVFLDKPFPMNTLRTEVQRALSDGVSPERKVGM